MIKVTATRYLAGKDWSVKPGDVISEAPFSFSLDLLNEWIGKGQAIATEESFTGNVEVFDTPDPDEYVTLVLDEYGNEVEEEVDETEEA